MILKAPILPDGKVLYKKRLEAGGKTSRFCFKEFVVLIIKEGCYRTPLFINNRLNFNLPIYDKVLFTKRFKNCRYPCSINIFLSALYSHDKI